MLCSVLYTESQGLLALWALVSLIPYAPKYIPVHMNHFHYSQLSRDVYVLPVGIQPREKLTFARNSSRVCECSFNQSVFFSRQANHIEPINPINSVAWLPVFSWIAVVVSVVLFCSDASLRRWNRPRIRKRRARWAWVLSICHNISLHE